MYYNVQLRQRTGNTVSVSSEGQEVLTVIELRGIYYYVG